VYDDVIIRNQADFGSVGIGSWRHLVGTLDGLSNVMKTYNNGEFVDSVTLGNSIGSENITSLLIGEYTNTCYNVDGKIPIVKIYNIALTQQQVEQNFNAYKNRFGI
jgi:hypothetical protein